jgi:alpha-1,6-mannosyltransferase
MTPTRSSGAALVASGAVLSACVAAWAAGGDRTARIETHLALYGVAFAAYLVALRAAGGLSRRGLGLALLAAVAWRLALVAAPPLVSNDVNRSVWEGRIQLHGGNPYRWADRPESPRWVPLRDAVWEGMNHRGYTAVYPPAWQLAARLVVRLHDSITALKGFLAGCELLMLWPLAALLRRRGLPRERLLVVAWSPLALVEVAGGGHNEAFGVLWLCIALWALEAGRPLASALALAVGFQAKLLPGLVAAAWARRFRPWQALAALVLAGLLAVPYASAGWGLLRSLGKYGQFWRFNETAFAPLAALLGSHEAAARAAVVLVILLAGVLAWRRAEPVAAALAVVTATLLLSPNVLPWYALWLLPLLAVVEVPALLLFTGTVGLAYLVYPDWLSGERWHLGWGVRALEYGPCLAVAVAGARRRVTEGPARASRLNGPVPP